jgi:hypothetical protein
MSKPVGVVAGQWPVAEIVVPDRRRGAKLRFHGFAGSAVRTFDLFFSAKIFPKLLRASA